MRFVAPVLALATTVFASQLHAQTPIDTTQSSPATTIKVSTRLVELDVVVTDPQGHPVSGFTRNDFTVTEDKAPEILRDFAAHTIVSEADYVAPNVPKLPPNTFLNILQAPERGIPTVILYDALNTRFSDQAYAHQEMLKFIAHRRAGTQVAIFILGDKLRLLQGFTEDTDLLTAALASRKGLPHTTTLLGPRAAAAPTPGALDGDPQFDQVLSDFSRMDRIDQGILSERRADITLAALAEIGRFLGAVPGRKNLVWLSSEFPAHIFSPGISHDRDDSIRTYSEEIRRVTDLLNLSRVAVYPVDVRGVRVSPVFSAARNASYGIDPFVIQNSDLAFKTEDRTTHSIMDSIAESTGGHAFYGTNDLQGAVDHAVTDGSTYYSLSYAPTNQKYDGSLRHIKVTLNQSGYTLAYRKTYYADDLEAAARAAADAPQSPLSPSLERGTPLAHDLLLEAHLDAAGAPAPATPAQMQVLSQYTFMQTGKKDAKPAPVMMQRYFISYGLIARQLDMPEDDKGAHQASLEFGVISYDDDGRKLNGLDTRVDYTIPPARFAKIASDGYHVAQSIFVPVNAASLRLAVRDIRSNRTGSIEVKLPLTSTGSVQTAAKETGRKQP